MSYLDAAIANSRQHAAACFDAFVKGVGTPATPPELTAAGRSGSFADFGQREANHHYEQLRHNRDRPYSIIRLVAQRIARQPIRVARLHDKGSKGRQAFWQGRAKAFDASGRVVPCSRLDLLPGQFKAMADNLEPYETHPLLTTLADPNPLMTSWALKFITIAQLEITGKAFWWTVGRGKDATRSWRHQRANVNLTPGSEEPPNQIWPLPPPWMTPIHEPSLFSSWRCQPNTMAQPFTIPGEKVVYYFYPNPEDLCGALSPMQAVSRQVAVGESISTAQERMFRNSVNPDLLITIGRHPELATGTPQRPMLSKEQRAQIIGWIKNSYRGMERYHEPLIMDALIEDVKRLSGTTTREMDFINSSKRSDEQLDQGFLVNSISMGRVEGANRASSLVADEHLALNNLDPKIELLSEVMTEWLGPQFALPGEKLVVYLEPIKTSDPDYILNEDKTLMAGCGLKYQEFRERHNLPEIPALNDYMVTPWGLLPMPEPGKPLVAPAGGGFGGGPQDEVPPDEEGGGAAGKPPKGPKPKPAAPADVDESEKMAAAVTKAVNDAIGRQPTTTVNAYIAPPAVTVKAPTVNVEASPVNVYPEFHIAPPAVNVEAPNVNVAAPNVSVAAPNVTVEPPAVTVEAPNVKVAAPTVNVAPPSVNVAAPAVNIEFPVVDDA